MGELPSDRLSCGLGFMTGDHTHSIIIYLIKNFSLYFYFLSASSNLVKPGTQETKEILGFSTLHVLFHTQIVHGTNQTLRRTRHIFSLNQ